jgi:predicted amidohydrolase
MPQFRIALAQVESQIGTETYDPRPDNLARAERAVAEAAGQGADLVLFGEMFLTGYHTDEWNPQYALHVDQPDPMVDRLADMARAHGVTLMMGTATMSPEPGEIPRNSAILVSGGGLLASYDKLHLGLIEIDGTLYDESQQFSGGSTAPIWDTDKFGGLGPQICYDSHFPEISRVQALNGADVLLNVTASLTGFENAWEHNRATRAIENSAWYVTCSVVGTQKGERYFGRSAVVDPMGQVVVQGADGVEDLVVADIDTDVAAQLRSRMHMAFSRHPEAYADLVRTNAIEVSR